MKWRHWRILILYVLIAYLAFGMVLSWSTEVQSPGPPPTRTPWPTFESVQPGPDAWIVLPTNTTRPSRTPMPPATETPAAVPSPAATSIPTLSPQPQPTATPEFEMITHTVQAGDNLLEIAQEYGTTVQAIIEANGITNPDLIFIGQTLLIPVPFRLPPSPTPSI